MIYFVMIALTPTDEDLSMWHKGDTGEPWNPPSVDLKWLKWMNIILEINKAIGVYNIDV